MSREVIHIASQSEMQNFFANIGDNKEIAIPRHIMLAYWASLMTPEKHEAIQLKASELMGKAIGIFEHKHDEQANIENVLLPLDEEEKST